MIAPVKEKISKIKDFWTAHPKIKKAVGIVLIIVGFFGLITPMTPFGIVFFIGLEMIGVKLLFIQKIRDFLRKGFPKHHL